MENISDRRGQHLFMDQVHTILNSLKRKIYAWRRSAALDAANTASHKLPLSIITQLASGWAANAYTPGCPAETVTVTSVLVNYGSPN